MAPYFCEWLSVGMIDMDQCCCRNDHAVREIGLDQLIVGDIGPVAS